MPRNDSPHYELTDAEKRDLIKLINANKPLPEKYRFLLFEDKREVELVWNGKTREDFNVPLLYSCWLPEILHCILVTGKRSGRADIAGPAGAFWEVSSSA